ncbi:MAG: CHAT domain-containing protein [Nostoc sp.]|uniref:CHAT domain-containing protein n=2 Tax=unclassified Nostoc TaxID=2593658 RepID=UPI002FF293A7
MIEEKRLNAYLKLIHELVQSSKGQEPGILEVHKNLIDAGLVETMKQVAVTLAEQGDEENATFIRRVAVTISATIGKPSSAENYVELILMLLQAVSSSHADPQVVYPFLQANLDKIDDKFSCWLKAWAIDMLIEENPISAEILATDIFNFSNLIAEFPLGSKASNIEIAIAGYEVAQTVFTPEAFSQECAMTQNSLAAAYIQRIRGYKAENIEIAITALQEALQVFNKQDFPTEWAMTQNSLAGAYIKRIQGDKAENLEMAITVLQAALEIITEKAFVQKWATIQNNLAVAYRDRIRGNKVENLELAIAACKSALQVFTKEAFPQEWAETQNNLGNSYRYRIKGDKAENIELAIACYQAAAKVFSQTDYPQGWADVKNNLGLAYLERIQKDKEQNIELAIFAFEEAYQIFTKEAFPNEWARTQNNLGITYLDRICGTRLENLDLAIISLQKSLQIFTKEFYPINWAMTQMNLGICYGEHFKEDYTNDLELAITAFQFSLQIRTQEAFPEDWALTHSNIGHIYNLHGYFTKAIESFQLALTVYQHNIFPLDCFITGRNLGNTAFSNDNWDKAIQGYEAAIDAVETSRNWVTSESRRQEIIEESIDVYQNMVQACINAGQIEKAFEYSERSRSKLLVDLMAGYNLSQGEVIPPKVQELLQQYEALQWQIDQERQSHKSENSRSETRAAWKAYNEAIASLETQKQQVWENLRREDPVLAGEIQVNPLSLSEIQKLIDQPNTAILSFYTTNSDTHIFVVQQNKITLHTSTGEGLNTLQGWINQNWLLPYINDSQKWETQINSILRELAERLQIPKLISQHLQGIEELILVPHLLLHQIPFAALPTGECQEYLGDKFLIRYTPSCQILDFCQQHETVGIFNEMSLQYGTVEDAEDNLPCARFEGEQLAKMYNIPPENRLIGSSQATSKNYRQLAQQVQVLHSCHHAQSRLDNPLESQLKLADGSITLGQLMTQSWRLPQLVEVFLSCCETNLGTPSLTDDILTLSTGFLCAGARSVVSTLWSVNDLATALFSIFYYQQRQEGKNRHEALHKAQIQLREFTKVDLNKIFQEVEAREKELIRNRKKYPSDSIEYQQWKLEYNMYTKLNRRIKEIENSTQQFPFSDPHYWAAFICHGLR